MESSEHPGDSPALPISFSAKYGSGHRRAVVLGGGGVAAVSWQVAYLDELAKGGLDLRSADLIVGTSAGSVVGSLLAGGRIGGAARELGLLTKVPALVAAMAPIGELKASQKRATMMFRQATDAALPTVQAIGYAALAADSPPAAQLPRTLLAVARIRSWGSDGLRIVTTDAYSGERLVLTKANSGVPVMRAAAASASVPGIFSPQPIGDRKCVDGGVAGSATHSDVVAGAERVLVLPLAAGVPAPGMYCQQPDSLARELDDLRSSGSEVELRVPDLPTLTTAELMSPSAIPIAMAAARTQAAGDLPALVEFWSR